MALAEGTERWPGVLWVIPRYVYSRLVIATDRKPYDSGA